MKAIATYLELGLTSLALVAAFISVLRRSERWLVVAVVLASLLGISNYARMMVIEAPEQNK